MVLETGLSTLPQPTFSSHPGRESSRSLQPQELLYFCFFSHTPSA